MAGLQAYIVYNIMRLRALTRGAGLLAGDGGMALAQELHAVVTPGGVRLLGTGHPHQQLRKLRQPLALAQQRKHQLVLQGVELQVRERLSSQRGLQEGPAALQLLRREVGRKAMDQSDAFGVRQNGGGLPEYRRQGELRYHGGGWQYILRKQRNGNDKQENGQSRPKLIFQTPNHLFYA